MTCPAVLDPQGLILECGAFHSLVSAPHLCINCGRSSNVCSSPRGETDFVKGCGYFLVTTDDLDHCKYCRQKWTRCLGTNGGVFPWDDPVTGTSETPRMDLQQARRLQKVYAILDDEGVCDGSIPSAKVIEILRIFGANPDTRKEKIVLRELDVDEDRSVSFRELCAYFAENGTVDVVSKETKQDNLIKLMHTFDRNKDGKFSKKEVKNLLTHMGQPLTPVEYTQCFKGLDMDNDGFLSIEELLCAFE